MAYVGFYIASEVSVSKLSKVQFTNLFWPRSDIPSTPWIQSWDPDSPFFVRLGSLTSPRDGTAPLDEIYTETAGYHGRTYQNYALTNGTYFVPVDEVGCPLPTRPTQVGESVNLTTPSQDRNSPPRSLAWSLRSCIRQSSHLPSYHIAQTDS